jgi:hypothetical protein
VPEDGVDYTISFIGCNKGESETSVLKAVQGTEANIAVSKDLLFVRCKITSSKLQHNPIENILYEEAWTQPIVVTD